jgi:DNA polymerase kappa
MHHDSFDDGDASSEDGGFLDEFVDAERALGTASGSGGSEASTSGVFTSAFVNHKAGMDEVDKAHVRQVVHDMSKDSAHHRNEQVRETKVLSKIREMLEKKRKLSDDQLRRYQREVDVFVSALETKRDLSKTWIHVDMDAFYAAVHTLRNPEYATIPIAVGGIGMISTANYVARKFGVRSAMPGFIAKKLCPQLTFVNSDFTLYKHYAGLAREVFRTYDPEFDALSLDEAFLDVTEYLVVNNLTPEEAASKLRLEVFQKTGLTCT